jgi:hypothetical protein
MLAHARLATRTISPSDQAKVRPFGRRVADAERRICITNAVAEAATTFHIARQIFNTDALP